MPLLAYWTRLYVLVLLLCLLVSAGVAGVWINIRTYEHHYDLLETRALQLSEVYDRLPEDGPAPERLLLDKPGRMGQPRLPLLVQVVDRMGMVYPVRWSPRGAAAVLSAMQEVSSAHREVLGGRVIRERVQIASQTWLRVGVPVYRNGSVTGGLYISAPTQNVSDQIRRLHGTLALATGVIGLAGWLVLYFLSRKLIRPLLQVADAARSIAGGKYDVALPQRLKERELQQMVTSFQDMASQLQKLEQLRTALLAGVSHELRTPVTSIRGMIQAVRDKVVSGKEAEEFLRISLDESKRLQQMVEELLDFSSLESGAAHIDLEELDLARLVDEVAQQILVLPGSEGLKVELSFPSGSVQIAGDAGRVRQILLNLAGNSRKASAGVIRFALGRDGDTVVLDVTDDGKGIHPADQPYIFERFYRGGQGNIKPRGLGLGLGISRLLARAHGGDLVLLQTSPGGTAFRLTLPAVPGRRE